MVFTKFKLPHISDSTINNKRYKLDFVTKFCFKNLSRVKANSKKALWQCFQFKTVIESVFNEMLITDSRILSSEVSHTLAPYVVFFN